MPMKNIQVNGRKICQMAMGNTIGMRIKLNLKHLRIPTKDNGNKESGQGSVRFTFLMVTNSKDFIAKI
jgi:hypothetical protein